MSSMRLLNLECVTAMALRESYSMHVLILLQITAYEYTHHRAYGLGPCLRSHI